MGEINLFNNVVLLAGGHGIRLKELTLNSPKALLDVNGRPLLSYSLDQLDENIDNIYITAGYKKSKIFKYFSDKKHYKIIDTSDKGNSWWIFNSELKYLNEPVLVLPCDIVTTLDFSFIHFNYIRLGSPPCMLVPVNPVVGIEGDYINEKNNMVLSLSRNICTPIYCSGIQIINPFFINERINEHDDFYQLWIELIHNKMLYVSNLYPHAWFSINTKEQYVRFLERNIYHKL